MVKTSLSSAGDAGSIPDLGAKISHASQPKAKISHASQPKNQNIKQSNFVTNSIETLKMIHIKNNS